MDSKWKSINKINLCYRSCIKFNILYHYMLLTFEGPFVITVTILMACLFAYIKIIINHKTTPACKLYPSYYFNMRINT